MRTATRGHLGTMITGAAALALAIGWSVREAQWASAQGERVKSGTINAADVKMNDADFEGKKTGQAGVYFNGETEGTRNFQVGRFLIDPGSSPHTPHKHTEEEVLIVSRGQGEIVVDGKSTPVRSGAVMYTGPNAEHGIKNTGERPLEFYWVKYIPSAK
jgi:mannose-6-phosphate isomerase-like protein (cupin superfamily)